MNIARMLFWLLASSTVVCALTTINEPLGVVIHDGETKEYNNETVKTPFVTVESGGTLILHGTTLLINGASEGAGNIWVKPGGTMRILEDSNITSANAYSYTFWVNENAVFEMRDSKMGGCGREAGVAEYDKLGLHVKADSAVIKGNIFGDNHYCLIINGARNVKVSGNAFKKCYRSLTVKAASSVTTENNNFETEGPKEFSVNLISSLDAVVSNNTFRNPKGLSLDLTNRTKVANNSFLALGEADAVLIGFGNPYSVENVLENNAIGGRLEIYGEKNVVKGGFVGSSLLLQPKANTNVFENVNFLKTKMTLNSQEVSGTAFENNVFNGTDFAEENAVLKLGDGNAIKGATFGKNATIKIIGSGNVIEGVIMNDAYGIDFEGTVMGTQNANVLNFSTVTFQKGGRGIVCDGPCRIENNTLSYAAGSEAKERGGLNLKALKTASFADLCDSCCVGPRSDSINKFVANYTFLKTEGDCNKNVTGVCDVCVNSTHVRERYCAGGSYPLSCYGFKDVECGAGYACVDAGECPFGGRMGKCALASCTDSDGRDIYVKGSVTDGMTTVWDSCVDASRVLEWYCSGGSMAGASGLLSFAALPPVGAENETIACPQGYSCVDGACKPREAPQELEALVTLRYDRSVVSGGSITVSGGLHGVLVDGADAAFIQGVTILGGGTSVLDEGANTRVYNAKATGVYEAVGSGDDADSRLLARSSFSSLALGNGARVRALSTNFSRVDFKDAVSSLQRDWRVAFSVVGEAGSLVQGAVITLSPSGGGASRVVRADNGEGVANVTQGVYSSSSLMEFGVFKRASLAGGSFNPYNVSATAPGYGESYSQESFTGDESFVIRLVKGSYPACASFGCVAAVCEAVAPAGFEACAAAGGNECGEGLHCFVPSSRKPRQNPPGVYFAVVEPNRAQLAGVIPIGVVLQYNGEALCESSVNASLFGPEEKAAVYVGCARGLHSFQANLSKPGVYTVLASVESDSFEGEATASTEFQLIGRAPHATPDIVLPVAAVAALLALYALRRK